MFHVNTFLSEHTKEVYNSHSYETLEIKRRFDSFYSLTALTLWRDRQTGKPIDQTPKQHHYFFIGPDALLYIQCFLKERSSSDILKVHLLFTGNSDGTCKSTSTAY